MLCLVARFDDQVLRFPLPAAEARIGSATTNDIVLPFPGISRSHARLTPYGSSAVLTDLGSKNGIVVNGERLDQVVLKRGVRVQVGLAIISVEERASSDIAIAIRIPQTPRSRTTAGPSPRSRSTDERSSAALPLGLIRDIERAGEKRIQEQLQTFVARTCEAINAECVFVIIIPEDGRHTLAATNGVVPDDEVIERVASRGSAARRTASTHFEIIEKQGIVYSTLRSGDGVRILAAVLRDRRYDPGAFDLFDFLAPKLLGGELRRETEDEVNGLRLPAGFVSGSSPASVRLLNGVRGAARGRADVLLTGETGTGKTLLARIIHDSTPRTKGRFVTVDCATTEPVELQELLLGSATAGARESVFLEAAAGTLLINNIHSLPAPLQPLLLDIIDRREIAPPGAKVARRVSCRIICTAVPGLEKRALDGSFRADLYYRMRGLEFRLPPLRERREDIPDFAASFVTRAAAEQGKAVAGISRSSVDLLSRQKWPGNIRELQSEISRAIASCGGGVLQTEHFAGLESGSADTPLATDSLDLHTRIEAVERETINAALDRSDGNLSLSARLLGVTRNGLAMKMKRLRITARRYD